ncbi:hypothetical protein Mapa_002560 [Marchantia paleacea]|nr:hypothetical protein Mapa_002560 [Marchantia paleacea]
MSHVHNLVAENLIHAVLSLVMSNFTTLCTSSRLTLAGCRLCVRENFTTSNVLRPLYTKESIFTLRHGQDLICGDRNFKTLAQSWIHVLCCWTFMWGVCSEV